MIDRVDVAVVVMAYRREPCRPLARWLVWLHDGGAAVTFSEDNARIDRVREIAAREFLAEEGREGQRRMIQVDADTCPTPEAAAGLLARDGELLYCSYAGRNGRTGHGPGADFGCGCFRVAASLLWRMGEPRFMAAEATDACECVRFGLRAIAAGGVPTCVGPAYHQDIAYRLLGPDGRVTYMDERDVLARQQQGE